MENVYRRMPQAYKIYEGMYAEDRLGVLAKAVGALIAAFVDECEKWAVHQQNCPDRATLAVALEEARRQLG